MLVLRATTAGFPAVRVPVLSVIRWVIFSARSIASAFFTKIPFWAPLPTPTMIDIGVASPRAQGQALIKTETGTTIA